MTSIPEDVGFEGIGPLFDIRQVSVEAKLHKVAGPALNADVQQNYGSNVEGEALLCHSSCTVAITDPIDGSSVFTATVAYMAAFQLLSSAALDDRVLEDFTLARVVGILEPFVRESIQSLTTKSGLPAFVLPVQAMNVVEHRETPPTPPPKKSPAAQGAKKVKAAKRPAKTTPKALSKRPATMQAKNK